MVATQSEGVDILYQPHKLNQFGLHKFMLTSSDFSEISEVARSTLNVDRSIVHSIGCPVSLDRQVACWDVLCRTIDKSLARL
jgi:hypothetical protein